MISIFEKHAFCAGFYFPSFVWLSLNYLFGEILHSGYTFDESATCTNDLTPENSSCHTVNLMHILVKYECKEHLLGNWYHFLLSLDVPFCYF